MRVLVILRKLKQFLEWLIYGDQECICLDGLRVPELCKNCPYKIKLREDKKTNENSNCLFIMSQTFLG